MAFLPRKLKMVVRERQPQAPERSSPESFLPALEQR